MTTLYKVQSAIVNNNFLSKTSHLKKKIECYLDRLIIQRPLFVAPESGLFNRTSLCINRVHTRTYKYKSTFKLLSKSFPILKMKPRRMCISLARLNPGSV